MEVKVSQLVKRVLMLLNESEEELSAAVIYGDMGMELRTLAADLVEEGVRKTLLDADFSDIDEVKIISGRYAYCADGVGDVQLPSDFLRLVELRMSNWSDSLFGYADPSPLPAAKENEEDESCRIWLRHHPVEEGLEEGAAKMRTGNWDTGNDDTETFEPEGQDAGIVTTRGVQPGFNDKGRVLRIYGVAPLASLAIAAYLPVPAVTDGSVWIPKGCVDAAVRTIVNMIKEIVLSNK